MSLTRVAEVGLRRFDQGNYYIVESGMASWRDTLSAVARPRPTASGFLVFNRLAEIGAGVSFEIDAHQVWAMMWMQSGSEFFLRIRAQGKGTNKPQVIYSGPTQIVLAAAESNVLRFNCTMRVNAVQRSIQP